MSVNSDMAESLRREKARNLRYKKAIHADLNLASIGSKLMEMYESASDVLYWCENDGESTQLDELIGDEEETYELRMAFSTLEGDCQQMLDDLDNEWVPEFFDGLGEASPELIDMGLDLVMELVDGIADAAPDMAQGAAELISRLITGLSSRAPELSKAALSVVTA